MLTASSLSLHLYRGTIMRTKKLDLALVIITLLTIITPLYGRANAGYTNNLDYRSEYDFETSLSEPTIVIGPGMNTSVYVNITTSQFGDKCTFTIEHTVLPWWLNVSIPDTVAIGGNTTTNVTVKLSTWRNVTHQTATTVFLNITCTRTNHTEVLDLNVDLKPVALVSLRFESGGEYLYPGSRETLLFNLSNNGTMDDTIWLDATARDGIELEYPDTVYLTAGEWTVIPLVCNVSLNVSTGPFSITLNAGHMWSMIYLNKSIFSRIVVNRVVLEDSRVSANLIHKLNFTIGEEKSDKINISSFNHEPVEVSVALNYSVNEMDLAGWSIEVIPKKILLPAYGSDQMLINIRSPSREFATSHGLNVMNFSLGVRIFWEFQSTSNGTFLTDGGNISVSMTLSDQVIVPEYMQPSLMYANPGDTVRFSLPVRNIISERIEAEVSLEGLPDGWKYTFAGYSSRSVITLEPGSVYNLDIYITTSNNTLSGDYTVKFRLNTSHQNTYSQATIRINQTYSFSFNFTTVNASGPLDGIINVSAVLINTGNGEDTFFVSPTMDYIDEVEIEPSIITLYPGEVIGVNISIRVSGSVYSSGNVVLLVQSNGSRSVFRVVSIGIKIKKPDLAISNIEVRDGDIYVEVVNNGTYECQNITVLTTIGEKSYSETIDKLDAHEFHLLIFHIGTSTKDRLATIEIDPKNTIIEEKNENNIKVIQIEGTPQESNRLDIGPRMLGVIMALTIIIFVVASILWWFRSSIK